MARQTGFSKASEFLFNITGLERDRKINGQTGFYFRAYIYQ